MSTLALGSRPYTVPRTGGSGRAIALAVVMHVLLGAFLFFGIHWQSSPPEVIQAELWSPTPQVAAPPPRPIPPQPKVEPTPQPKVEPEPVQPKADIVEKAPPKKAEPPKPQPKPVEKVEPKKEPVKQPPPKEAPPRAPSDLANILAAANGPPTSQGKDQQTSGPRGRDTYFGRLRQAIHAQMRYPGSPPGNPTLKVRIDQLPTGEVTDVTVINPSGIPALDDAVVRAVHAASPLPKDEQGKVERTLTFDYYLYDKN